MFARWDNYNSSDVDQQDVVDGESLEEAGLRLLLLLFFRRLEFRFALYFSGLFKLFSSLASSSSSDLHSLRLSRTLLRTEVKSSMFDELSFKLLVDPLLCYNIKVPKCI